VLTVGGLDDQNRLAFAGYGMYHSSYGPTVDGLQKPEVIAPGIWVAAPILPGTPTAGHADWLSRLASAGDDEINLVARSRPGLDPAVDAAASLEPSALRRVVESRLREANLISASYKHVDGTSFAAPIVASLAAQILEAAPDLAPREVKRILIDTARRIPNVDVARQGWGVVDAPAAVARAREITGERGLARGVESGRRPGRAKRREGEPG
jgi:serine protease AprX